jgi:N-methylhydantoinase A
MTEFRVRGVGELPLPALNESDTRESAAEAAVIDHRPMYFKQAGGTVDAPVYRFEDLAPGDAIDGPGVVLTPVTTIVVNPGDTARMDRYRNVRIDIGGEDG